MPGELATVCDDLAAEHAALDALVGDLEPDAWDTPTPATGWRIREQIAHLTYFDGTGALAILDPDAFARHLELVQRDHDAFARESRASVDDPVDTMLRSWRDARESVVTALRATPAGARLPWYGPPMSAVSFATARLMETWAHGTDVADALDRALPDTSRLRHIAHLGVRTRGWSYAARGLEPPPGEVHVALVGPDGDEWTWGPADSPDRVSGAARDFCLVVTQRRHVDDTALRAEGPAASEWLAIAQAFAGDATLAARRSVPR
jgi:uncharacterized protein (TIGR03084 family)